MQKYRDRIDENPKKFLETISFFDAQDIFIVEGERYKRFQENNHGEKIQDWYQRKNLYLVCNRQKDKNILSHNLIDHLSSGFVMLKPVYYYLWNIL
jgi:hypothetical protein